MAKSQNDLSPLSSLTGGVKKRAKFGHEKPFQYTQASLERLPIERLDKMAFGVNDGDRVNLHPSQINIQYPGDLENPQDKFSKGGMNWVRSVDLTKPVNVSMQTDGKYYLEDGHHRWFAASKLNKPLTADVEVKGKPIQAILRKHAEQSAAGAAVNTQGLGNG